MRLVAHIAKAEGGDKGDIRTTLCGKSRALMPEGRPLIGCVTCLRKLKDAANAGSGPTYVANSATTTVTVTMTPRSTS